MCTIQNKILKFFTNNATPERKTSDIYAVLCYGSENKALAESLGLTHLFCIYYLISQAYSSVDLCIPSLVSETIVKALVNAVKKGVKIRIAIHKSQNFVNLPVLSEHGIEVKVINSERLEHEFLLIDANEPDDEYNKAIAVLGALDYSIANVNCNNDNTMIISDDTLISTLKQEFDRVWYTVPMEHENFDNVTTGEK